MPAITNPGQVGQLNKSLLGWSNYFLGTVGGVRVDDITSGARLCRRHKVAGAGPNGSRNLWAPGLNA